MNPEKLYSQEAEKAIIGCMIVVTDEAIDESAEALVPDDFFVPAYREIYSVLLKMRDGLEAIDIPTIHQKLSDSEIADKIGSPGILSEIVGSSAVKSNLGAYIKIVRDKSMRRNLKKALREVSEAVDVEESTEELLAMAEQKIGEAMNRIQTNTLKTASEVAESLRTALKASVARRGQLLGIHTGFPKLDAITGGWKPTKVILVAGRPGDGKSVLGENFSHAAAKVGYKAGIVTLEMDAEEHGSRTIAHEAEVSTVRQMNGNLDSTELDRCNDEIDKFAKLPIYYEDCHSINLNGLRCKLRKMVYKQGIDLAVLDYLTLVETDDDKDNETMKIRKIMRAVKSLARELKIPIVVLAQINRKGAEDSHNGELGIHHIRSGGEDDPDIIILLQRKLERTPIQIERDYYPTRFIIGKNRGGPTGYIDTILDAVHNKFNPV